MATTRGRRPKGRSASRTQASSRTSIRALERRLARLAADVEAARRRHTRQAAALRRAADRRVAALVGEIAGLRHHEARAQALARLVAERDTALAEQAARIARLEALLHGSTPVG